MSLAAGCAKRSPEASTSPAMDIGAGDELAMLEQQLTQREAQLQAAGFRPRATRAASGPGRDGGDMKAGMENTPSAPSRPSEPAPMTDSAGEAGTATSVGTTGTSLQNREDAPGGRCQQVCEITAAICALERQICDLVPRHPDDERYQAACRRAADDCRFATEACHACT